MAYNNELATRIVFDIETAPLDGAAAYLEPVDAPANYKDPVKIADYIAAKQAEQVDRCGLDLDLCRIVALGLWTQGEESIQTEIAKTDADERVLLAAFAFLARTHHFVGFNCLAFDLPVLLRRAQYLGVAMPALQVDKFKHPQVTDLAMMLSFNGLVRMRSLRFYAQRFNLGVDDPLKGEDMAAAVAEGRWADVEAHVRADVRRTGLLASRLGCFQLPVEAPAIAVSF